VNTHRKQDTPRRSRVLVTGASGFAGRWLIPTLNNMCLDCIGITGCRLHSRDPLKSLLANDYQIDLSNHSVDLLDVVGDVEYLVHLASITPHKARIAGLSDSDLFIRNSAIDSNIVQYIKDVVPKKSVIISSCAVYGNSPRILTEDSPLMGKGVYADCKMKLESSIAKLPKNTYNTVIVRSFNHSGPGQPLGFFIPDTIQRATARKLEKAVLKNANAVRDFLDVRDIVNAYGSLLMKDNLRHNVYNVCSGKGISTLELNTLIQNRLSKVCGIPANNDIQIENTGTEDRIVGDNSRLVSELGWKRKVDIEKSIDDYLMGALV